MGFKILPKTALNDWVHHLSAGYRVIGPQPRHGQFVFEPLKHASDLRLDYPTSVLPPKKYLLPTSETLFRFEKHGKHLQPEIKSTPTVILGIHTCDLYAIRLLDRVHSQGYPDQHYLAHRRNTLLVGIECLKPCMEHSFCKSMGTLTASEGFDLHLTDLGDRYVIDIGSEKGAELLAGFDAVRDESDADYKQLQKVLTEKWPRFPYRLDFDVTELPDLLNISMKSPTWQELGDRCLACGMCTNVCPTCTCFDVQDEADLSLENGRRFRRSDSCQVEEFALVAGGHNFRAARALRQRHRFLRKGKYQFEAYELLGCVGCGRCAQACLVHITPVDTFNELYRRSHASQTTGA